MSMPAYDTPGAPPIGGGGEEVLDVAEVARILNRDPHTVRRYFREGTIPGAKRLAGGRWIILRVDLESFLHNP
jgi:hypothetical protein